MTISNSPKASRKNLLAGFRSAPAKPGKRSKRPSRIPAPPAAVSKRILPRGAGQSPRLCPFLGIPAQDHSRGRHHHRLHWIRDLVSKGETCVESSRGIRLSWRGRVLRLRIQGSRTGRLNNLASTREEILYAPLASCFVAPYPALRICARLHRRILEQPRRSPPGRNDSV